MMLSLTHDLIEQLQALATVDSQYRVEYIKYNNILYSKIFQTICV